MNEHEIIEAIKTHCHRVLDVIKIPDRIDIQLILDYIDTITDKPCLTENDIELQMEKIENHRLNDQIVRLKKDIEHLLHTL